MNPYRKLAPLAAAAGLLVTAGTASAATVLIDWSISNDISGVADGNGNFWNSLGSGFANGGDFSATALTASNNTASGWSVAVDLTGNTSNNTGAGFGGTGINGPIGATAPFNATGTNRPSVDGIFANYNANGTATITFTGLAASTQYDFSLIGGRASNGSNGYIKVLTGTAGAGASDIDLLETGVGTGKYAADDFLDTFSLLNDGTIASFSVTSNVSGSIAFDFFEGQNDTNGTTNATFNAMSITQVPEPSAALLGGLGFLVLLRRRRA